MLLHSTFNLFENYALYFYYFDFCIKFFLKIGYNSLTIKFTISLYCSLFFSVFTQLYNHCNHLIQNIFIIPKRKHCIHQQSLSIPLSELLFLIYNLSKNVLSVCRDLPGLNSSYKWNQTIQIFLYLSYYKFKAHSYYSMKQCFFPFFIFE